MACLVEGSREPFFMALMAFSQSMMKPMYMETPGAIARASQCGNATRSAKGQ